MSGSYLGVGWSREGPWFVDVGGRGPMVESAVLEGDGSCAC